MQSRDSKVYSLKVRSVSWHYPIHIERGCLFLNLCLLISLFLYLYHISSLLTLPIFLSIHISTTLSDSLFLYFLMIKMHCCTNALMANLYARHVINAEMFWPLNWIWELYRAARQHVKYLYMNGFELYVLQARKCIMKLNPDSCCKLCELHSKQSFSFASVFLAWFNYTNLPSQKICRVVSCLWIPNSRKT